MNEQQNASRVVPRIPRPGCAVKARIYAAGLSLTEIAQAARISRPSLSNYLAGYRATFEIQYDIYLAFCRLSGTDLKALSISEFWGSLYRRRAS
jgi:transcriptional regulator with XRE-family HTH domain